MVSVARRRRGKRTYYALIHNAGKRQYERYLGKSIPGDVEQRKGDFRLHVLRSGWKPRLDAIAGDYRARPASLIRQDLEDFSLEFTHDTQKIEGSSMSRRETYNLLRHSLTPHSRPLHDMQEAIRHHQVWLKVIGGPAPATRRTILSWHRDMFSKTKPEMAGKFREYGVCMKGSRSAFPHWKFVPNLVDSLLAWYRRPGDVEPAELAGTAHFRFESIHPFGDGNGRVGRILMNHALARGGMPPLNISYSDRRAYFAALERGQTRADEIHFLEWFMRYYVKKNAAYGAGAGG